jgi:NAD(P)-dependent dehydrogenase (short-subunit alcohol dehydrogenase family)
MAILDKFSLQGKVALVTGGAGTAGQQIVAAMAEAGATTIIASRSVEAIEAIAVRHREQGSDVSAVPYDQAEEASILALRDEVVSRHGRIDVLINNAVARPMKAGFEDEAATFARSMEINATGLFLLTRAIGDVMA